MNKMVKMKTTAWKRILIVAGLLTVFFLFPAVSLSCDAAGITVSLGQEFTLRAGKTAVIIDEDLALKFVEVTGDSRCATGVECIQAGDAKCRMLITYIGSASEVIFMQSGSSENNQQVFNQYTINFHLEPYPEAGKQIAKSDYKLVMTITK